MSKAGKTALDDRLLAMLVCPVTRTALRFDPERACLISEAAGLAFPVIDGIPDLRVETATPWAPADGVSPVRP
jgi:uncharacterized protein YbaR (Trm112 family)